MKIAIALVLNLLVVNVFTQWDTNGTNIYNTNAGRVGIGTPNPAGKLHVAGNIYATDNISARQYVTVTGVGGSYRIAINDQSDSYIVARNVALETKFQISTNGVSFLNGGNVGIGTISKS